MAEQGISSGDVGGGGGIGSFSVCLYNYCDFGLVVIRSFTICCGLDSFMPLCVCVTPLFSVQYDGAE